MKVFSNIDYDLIRKLVLEYFDEVRDLDDLLSQLVNRVILPGYLWELKLDIQHENIGELIDELYEYDSSFIDEERIIWVVLLLESLHSVEWSLIYAIQAGNASWLKLKYKTALLLDRSKEIIPAINLSRQIVNKNPNYQEVYTLLGLLSSKIGDAENTLGNYSHAIHLDSKDYWVRYSYAVWCIEQNNFDTAIDQLQIALELNPTSTHSWLQLAKAYHNLGDKFRYEESINKARELGLDIADSLG